MAAFLLVVVAVLGFVIVVIVAVLGFVIVVVDVDFVRSS